MAETNNNLNVRRLVGAILLALGGANMFIEAMRTSGYGAFSDAASLYSATLFYFAAWSVGISIWYFVTLTKPTHKKAELIVKIIFYILISINTIFAFASQASDAGIFGVILIIVYSIACPWGKLGYKKHPYTQSKKTQVNN